MRAAREKGVPILPVDSEHSAIFQCLQGAAGNRINRILLTASGGPFFGMSREQMRHVTKEQALHHPSRMTLILLGTEKTSCILLSNLKTVLSLLRWAIRICVCRFSTR